jgi:methyl-accepting chemotaxis protein
MFSILASLANQHDWHLVAVAAAVGFVASLIAVDLFDRARATQGRGRAASILAAGTAVGFGIWATHFIAMLAYDPGLPVAYNIGWTALSLAAAAAFTGAGLAIAAYVPGRTGAPLGGAVIGVGIACTHYCGMRALELPGRIEWSGSLVFLSIALGVLLSGAALIAANRRSAASRLLAAALLALAIVSLHFTAMGAVEIVPDPARAISPSSLSPLMLALVIAGAALTVLGMCLASAFDGRAQHQNLELLATALNNMTQGVVMFDWNERLVVCNDRYVEMYGLSPDIVKPGCVLADIINNRIAIGSLERNAAEYRAEILAAMKKGETSTFIVEDAAGRAISVINRPIAGGQYWVGTHEDVTARRRAERQSVTLAEQEARRASIDAAIHSFRESVEAVLRTVGESAAAMRSTATALLSSSGETSQSAIGAVQTSNVASKNVVAASDAAEELLSSIAEISAQLGKATALVEVAVAEAKTTNDEIAGLAHAAQEIGEVVNLIRHIAGQTNLLALNATIEAARAGEAGRGFAVVASEVKSLAVQTAKATEKIAAQISAVQNSTASAVAAIRRNTEHMQAISRYASAVSASVDQQNTATSEISHNVAGAAQGTKEVVAVLEDVAGGITKTRASVETVLRASEAVETAAGNLREKVETFLNRVAV